MRKLGKYLMCAALTFCTSTLAYSSTESVVVAPGDSKEIIFQPDSTGMYGIQISASGNHQIKTSDFKASFKSTTLWTKDSLTAYSIAYTARPIPPAVGIEGTFSGTGSGSGSGSPPRFEIDAAAATTVAVYSHTVRISGGLKSHVKIVITVHPDDSDAITGLPAPQNDEDKNLYFTIGAGRKGLISGKLNGDFNREPNDIVITGSTLHALLASSTNAIPLINSLIAANNNYNDDIPYSAFPDSQSDGRNSNSYIAGILLAVGVDPPSITDADVPGYDVPVDALHFQ